MALSLEFLILPQGDVTINIELGKAAVDVFNGYLDDPVGLVHAGHVDLRVDCFAVFKHILGLAPGAHDLAGIDHLVALFADSGTEHVDHGLVHEFDGIVLTRNINAIFHGIENIHQAERCCTFHVDLAMGYAIDTPDADLAFGGCAVDSSIHSVKGIGTNLSR